MADPRVPLPDAIADHYTLEREIGRGGMATVYLVHDRKHDRPVALKVLQPEIAATLGAERFQREIMLASRLQHPHILTVLDSGEAAGQLWFTMPYVEGESLRDRLAREGQLPLEDALRIAREAADALDYAHRHGVIHRDVKPENILLTETHALVADFGIARALGGAHSLTQTGVAVGTPGYMSPEQASGERSLDGRTDVYALGCVLYEMLAGEPPYSGPTAQAIIARAMTERPRPIHRVRPTVSDSLDAVIAKAMAAAPADRYTTAAEFARALGTEHAGGPIGGSPPIPALHGVTRRPLFLTLAAGFLLGVGVLFAWHRSAADGAAAGHRVLAVLPFENLGSPSDEYFADGMSDEVRAKLAGVQGLDVIARGSSTPYKRTAKSLQLIAQELGARYLLTGAVRWERLPDGTSMVHVSPELVQVGSGAAPTTRWDDSFDAKLTNVFQVQADIATRVAQALDVELAAGARQRLAAPPTANLAAYDAFLRGEEAAQSMTAAAPSLRRAVAYYEQAVALDSGYVEAWGELSRAHAALYAHGTPTPVEGDAARRAAERALALAPASADGHFALGTYDRWVLGNDTLALEQHTEGVRLAPSSAELLAALALDEWSLRRYESAIEHYREAERLNPRSIATAQQLGASLTWLRRYDDAMRTLDRGLAVAPANLQLLQDKAMVYLAQGDLTRARATLSTAPPGVAPTTLVAFMGIYWDLMWALDDTQQRLLLRLRPSAFDEDRAQWGIVLAQTCAVRGDSVRARVYADSARIAFEEHLRAAPNDAQQHVLLGLALAYLGRKADAVREGERGVALWPLTRDAVAAPYMQHQLARIYLIVHEPEKALDRLEPLLRMPYYVTPGWLRVDPNFDPIRKNPRFERLAMGK